MADRVYWRVGQSSELMTVVEQAIEQQKQFEVAMGELEKEFGGKVWLYGRSGFCGMEFDGEIPEGWRKPAKGGPCRPDLKTKAGRELRRHIESIRPGVDGWEFSRMMAKPCGGEVEFWGEGHVYFPTLERVGGVWVIGIPAQITRALPGCRRLKMSEYWALKEATDGK